MAKRFRRGAGSSSRTVRGALNEETFVEETPNLGIDIGGNNPLLGHEAMQQHFTDTFNEDLDDDDDDETQPPENPIGDTCPAQSHTHDKPPRTRKSTAKI